MAGCKMLKEADLPLETAILLIAGMTMLIAGILLFPVASGRLPFYEDGFFGLLLVMFSLQIITLGKTPFGDVHRSKKLLTVGVAIAAMGIVTSFIPEFSGRIPRALLVLSFGPGGFILLLQMLFSREKFRTWLQYGGIFRHLLVGCLMVYFISMMIAILILENSLLTVPLAAMTVMFYGVAIIYLAGVLRKIYRMYPEAEKYRDSDVGISTEQLMLLLMAVFMVILGILIIPVNLGMLPFSGSAQLGLLMVMFAIQMLASGSTPIGAFSRSWLMVLLGLVFAAMGIVSCMIPGVLVSFLTVFVGILNILGGIIPLAKRFVPRKIGKEQKQGEIPPIVKRLFATQVGLNLLGILFGVSMLVSWLLPGVVIGLILAGNGCVLFYLLHILIDLEKMRCDATK